MFVANYVLNILSSCP